MKHAADICPVKLLHPRLALLKNRTEEDIDFIILP